MAATLPTLAGIKGGWHVTVACVIGFAVRVLRLGWPPDSPPNAPRQPLPQVAASVDAAAMKSTLRSYS